jgi:hypothetical protein
MIDPHTSRAELIGRGVLACALEYRDLSESSTQP